MVKSLFVSLAFALAVAAGPVLAADPSVNQIYTALASGHVDDAQRMINEVLKDHPQSGHAHYVAAEVAARRGNLGLAREELATAERLKPGLPFAKPESVNELRRQLAQRSVVPRSVSPPVVYRVERHSSFPWGWVLLIGGVILLWVILRRRAAYRTYPGPVGGPMPGPMGGPMMGGPMMGGGMAPPGGGGILGGLASGLAIGAGVAAGEELVHHMLDGDRGGGVIPNAGASEAGYPDNPNSDMGGQDFGINDGGGWDDGGGGGGGGGGGDDWT
jgi:hypothetical protein